MNELQITLLIVGGGGIAAMIGYNWWQDFKLRRQASERFGANSEDPLLKGDRLEPGMALEEPADDEGLAPSVNEPATECDNRLFSHFYVQFDESVAPDLIRPLMDKLEHVNRKAVVFSVSPDDVATEIPQWFDARTYAGQIRQLKLSLQLANRKGALTSIEFSEVVNSLRQVAEAYKGHLEFSEMKEVVSKAETLDKAAAALDTVVGLHCMMPEEVEESIVVDRLATSGWIRKGKQWRLSTEGGDELSAMVVHEAPGKRLLSFSIDVPNSVDPIKALGEIVTLCHSLNQEYGAPLMDDSGQVLSTEAIQGIYEQLTERVNNLVDSGFAPGSAVAKILFA